jgi:hypothetical protein
MDLSGSSLWRFSIHPNDAQLTGAHSCLRQELLHQLSKLF